LDGEKIRYRIPATDEARQLVGEIRANREAIIALLRDRETRAPSLDEVRACLPDAVKVVSYRPKEAPFAVAPVSVVTDAGRFYRAYLANLRERLAKPDGYSCPPLTDILAKLADGGLQVEVVSK
jgi:hypothetical protein